MRNPFERRFSPMSDDEDQARLDEANKKARQQKKREEAEKIENKSKQYIEETERALKEAR